MRIRHKKTHSAKPKVLLFRKIKWWGIASIVLIVLVALFFGGSSITVKAANFLASFKVPARSATDTASYPYFEPDTQVLVYSGIGGDGWQPASFRQIRRGQEYLYEGKFYDIDPNGWVRFNSSVTATESNLTEADRVFEPYNSRLPEPTDLVRYVDSQNNHLRHNNAGACQNGEYFWFQGALYYCVASSENPSEHTVKSTYHVLNADGQVIPVEEFALARGDSLEDVYGYPVNYPASYTESPATLPILDSGNGLPTDYGFTGHRLDSATGLIYMNSRYYDPQLGRFISPDTIIPERNDSAAFDRYAYARNNPVLYVDPSGHCWGIASGIRGLPTYDVTCNNLDMALSIVQHPNATFGQKAGAAAYIAVEGTAHAALVAGVGMLAWEGGAAVLGSGAATTAGTTASSAATAACADGDCTNEISTLTQADLPAIQQFAQNASQIHARSFGSTWEWLSKSMLQLGNESRMFVARSGGNITGMMQVRYDANGYMIERLEGMGGGAGTQLFTQALQDSIAKGYNGISLFPTQQAINFYARFPGYQVLSNGSWYWSAEAIKKILSGK